MTRTFQNAIASLAEQATTVNAPLPCVWIERIAKGCLHGKLRCDGHLPPVQDFALTLARLDDIQAKRHTRLEDWRYDTAGIDAVSKGNSIISSRKFTRQLTPPVARDILRSSKFTAHGHHDGLRKDSLITQWARTALGPMAQVFQAEQGEADDQPRRAVKAFGCSDCVPAIAACFRECRSNNPVVLRDSGMAEACVAG